MVERRVAERHGGHRLRNLSSWLPPSVVKNFKRSPMNSEMPERSPEGLITQTLSVARNAHQFGTSITFEVL